MENKNNAKKSNASAIEIHLLNFPLAHSANNRCEYNLLKLSLIYWTLFAYEAAYIAAQTVPVSINNIPG